MSAITTHVLDTARGRPAGGVPIVLLGEHGGGWQELAAGTTNEDGRVGDLLDPERRLEPGHYRLIFDTRTYFAATGAEGFYPEVAITFHVRARGDHYHVPLLLSPFGYSTYRGS